MPDYRVCQRDDSGSILKGSYVECDDDDVAMDSAMSMSKAGVSIEVWLGVRRVGIVPPAS